jgi:hypothetical protein
VEAALRRAGFNAFGCLEAGHYDALVPPAWRRAERQPAARSALLLGAGGRDFFAAFERSPEAGSPNDPVDRYTRRVADAAAGGMAGVALLACDVLGGAFADFVALGREAGLGAPSRLGLLLHPEFGPWLSLRAVVLTPRELAPTPPRVGFDPCRGCPAPCADACPGLALAGARFDVAACTATRAREPRCRERCDARRACVVGPEHRYQASAEAYHMGSVGSP